MCGDTTLNAAAPIREKEYCRALAIRVCTTPKYNFYLPRTANVHVNLIFFLNLLDRDY